MKTTNFIAADLGAGSGRVLLAKWDGERFELEELHRFPTRSVQIPLSAMHSAHQRSAHQRNAVNQWDILYSWSEIQAGIAKYSAHYDTPPASFGIDTWGVDYGLIDKYGQLLGNPVQYRDHRCDGMVEKVFEIIPQETIFNITGIQFMQINTLYQLASMRFDNDPMLDAADTLLMIPDLINFWLTGTKGVEYTNASTTQMLHAQERRWATELIQPLNLPEHIFPNIIEPGSNLGPILPAVMAETGLTSEVPVIAVGSHDTGSAVAGIPGLDSRSAYISSGTWSLIGMEVPQPIINETTASLNFTNEGGVAQTIRLLKNIGGLWLLQECQRHWARGGNDYGWDELVAAAKAVESFRSIVDPDAPVFLNPDNMIESIQTYCKETNQPAPESVGQIVRCCLESLALRYRWATEALERILGSESGKQLDTIRIVGGGSQNQLLSQFTADACQRSVVTGPVEATALGNVMMQAIATGHLSSMEEGRAAIGASVEQQTFEPSADDGVWDEAFEQFEQLCALV
ncbi:MAG: rhamnulokinase family protein [Chloroflexota bacterium]